MKVRRGVFFGLGMGALFILILVKCWLSLDSDRAGEKGNGRATRLGEVSGGDSESAGPSLAGKIEGRPVAELPVPSDEQIQIFRNVLLFEPEDFSKSWNHVYENYTPVSQRDLFLRQICVRMAGLGHPDVAVRTVLESFGEGETRRSLIEACMAYADSLNSYERAFQLLSDDADRTAALSGLTSCLARDMATHSGAVGLADYKLSFLSEERLSAALEDAAKDYLIGAHHASSTEGRAALEAIMHMGFEGEALAEILGSAATLAPFDVWEHYQGAASKMHPDVGKRIADAMVSEDPERAISAILAGGDASHLEAGIRAWSRKDARSSREWFEGAEADLRPDQFKAAVRGICHQLCLSKDFSESRAFLSGIDNLEVKRELEGAVWGWEREALRSEASANPRRIVEELSDGSGRYDAYWLEEAMSIWMEKSFSDANHWYEDNWESLPGERAQYVAAAFAKQAVEQGDAETARQWAGMIEDAKTRERIEGIIEKGGVER